MKSLVHLFLLSLLFVSGTVLAGLENIRFQRIALEQGLSQESVFAIYQDRQGYMWFGTQEGLNRYDGYSFKVYSHNDREPGSLANDIVYSIAEDAEGQLWVGTAVGISIYDGATQSFSHFRHDASDEESISNNLVRVIFKDSNGTIWLGTDNGLNKYIAETNTFVRIDLDKEGSEDNSETVVWDITQDQIGNIWVGTDQKGLFRINLKSEQIEQFSITNEGKFNLSSQRVRSLMADNANRLWVGTYDQGIDRIDLTKMEINRFKSAKDDDNTLSTNFVKDIYQDNSGTIWVSTDFGLNRYEEDDKSFYRVFHEENNRYTLADNKLSVLFQDRGGVFWVGSYRGLSKWNTATANFEHYRVLSNPELSLSNNSVNAFAEGNRNDVWVGTYAGLNRLDLSTSRIESYTHDSEMPNTISSDRVMSLHFSDDDKLWIGTRNKGMDLLDVTTGKFSNYSYLEDVSNTISSNAITSISNAGKNKLWITTFGGGLNLFDTRSNKFTHFRADPNNPTSVSSDRIFIALPDSVGMVWLGTWGTGVNLFNPTTETAIQIKHDPDDPNSLSSNNIISILEDSRGNIWIGTQGAGLNKLTEKDRLSGDFKFERISRHEGLPSNVVYGILEDGSGKLWLSTNRGISKYDPLNKSIVNYDSSHGLQGNEFNIGASHKTSKGQFFFGGSDGATAFFPDLIKPNAHVPPVVLTNFLRLNESFSPIAAMKSTDAIQINYQDYLIAFEFAGLDFASPTNNQYSYKLEGFDEDWIEAGDLRRATYTNLPAGNYHFKVKASNNDGVWNEQGANLALTVLPAPWYSWWAYLGYTLIALLAVAMLFRSYLNKLHKEAQYRAQLEEEVKSRTQELSLANEQLLNASVTDQLTGLHNRRYLSNIIEGECAKVQREVVKLSKRNAISVETGPRLFCLMFDLDGFKPINDTYGHDVGDQIICQVSDLLRKVCRKSDTVIRWGGDEFLIVGRIEDMLEVNLLAERIRSEIVKNGFDIGLKQRLHVSCSIGYSMYPFSPLFPDSFSWEQVQIIADRALYCSKDAGRNHWTGIIATEKQPSVSLMNSLVNNLDQALEKGFVTLKETETAVS